MSRKKKQHYVPKFYLNLFTTSAEGPKSQDYLWILDKSTGRIFKKAPQNIAFETYFYSIQVEDGISNIIEDMLSGIESDVSSLFKEIVNGRTNIIGEKERYLFGRFVSFLNYRTVRADTIFDVLNQNVLKDNFINQVNEEGGLQTYLKSRNKDWSPDEFLDSFNKMKITVSKEMKIHLMINAALRMIPPLCVRNWAFLKAQSEDCPFITSDHPVVLYNKDCNQDNFVPGYYLRDTDILFPMLLSILRRGLNILTRKMC